MTLDDKTVAPGFFRKRKDILERELKQVKQKMRRISQWRIAVFLITVFGIYLTSTTNWLGVSTVAVSGSLLFALLVIFHLRLEKKRQFTETLLDINTREIRLYQRDVTGQDRGDNFTPEHHPYAGDLDITGDRSLFQLCDRTS